MKMNLHRNPGIKNRPLRFALGVILTAFVVFSIVWTATHKASAFEWLVICMGCLILMKNALVMFFQAFGCDPFGAIRNPEENVNVKRKKTGGVAFSHKELHMRYDDY